MVIGVPAKSEEKLSPLSAMKQKKSKITVLEICGKEHTFQRALDNSRELEDVAGPRKKSEEKEL